MVVVMRMIHVRDREKEEERVGIVCEFGQAVRSSDGASLG